MSSSVEGDLVFDSFPPPLSSEHLRNLYINRSLDLLNVTENNFLKVQYSLNCINFLGLRFRTPDSAGLKWIQYSR